MPTTPAPAGNAGQALGRDAQPLPAGVFNAAAEAPTTSQGTKPRQFLRLAPSHEKCGFARRINCFAALPLHSRAAIALTENTCCRRITCCRLCRRQVEGRVDVAVI